MQPWNRPLAAVAHVRGGAAAPHLTGTVRFQQGRHGVMITAHIAGLPAGACGIFALHIHEGGACTGDGFADTGGHYNPAGADHPCHAGDLPPLFATGGGRAELRVLTDRFSVREIIGRTVVIHSGPDDFTTQPAGNAGSKIACGVIQPA